MSPDAATMAASGNGVYEAAWVAVSSYSAYACSTRSRTRSCEAASATGRSNAKLRRSPLTVYWREGNVVAARSARRSQTANPTPKRMDVKRLRVSDAFGVDEAAEVSLRNVVIFPIPAVRGGLLFLHPPPASQTRRTIRLRSPQGPCAGDSNRARFGTSRRICLEIDDLASRFY